MEVYYMSEYWTMVERIICAAMDKKYKYIARDKNGMLCAYVEKPHRDNEECVFKTHSFEYWELNGFNNAFRQINWNNSPIKIDDIVQDKAIAILDETEVKYLKLMIMPFCKQVVAIVKVPAYTLKYSSLRFYKIRVTYKFDKTIKAFDLPPFEESKDMYKGMEVNKHYTLDELGLI